MEMTIGNKMNHKNHNQIVGTFSCPDHRHNSLIEIDMETWNEEHGNGFLGKR